MSWLELSAGLTENPLGLGFVCTCPVCSTNLQSLHVTLWTKAWPNYSPDTSQTWYFCLREVLAAQTGPWKRPWTFASYMAYRVCFRKSFFTHHQWYSLGICGLQNAFVLILYSTHSDTLEHIWFAETQCIPLWLSKAMVLFTWSGLLLKPVLKSAKASTQIQTPSGTGLGTSDTSFVFTIVRGPSGLYSPNQQHAYLYLPH